MKTAFWIILINCLIVGIIFFICESGLLYLVRHPGAVRILPRQVRAGVQQLYIDRVRDNIQERPDCARMDAELGYTLRPGNFIFSGIEFNTGYQINSQGLRDDEKSLIAPDMIVLGDSYAMGWGVRQNETFANIIEHESGLKVLNAAISGYGTASEMQLLRRLDTSRLKYLVVQYCYNDWTDNAVFFLAGNRFPSEIIRTRQQRMHAEYRRQRQYAFGSYTWSFIYSKIETIRRKIHMRAGVRSVAYPPQRQSIAAQHASQLLIPLEDVKDVLISDMDFQNFLTQNSDIEFISIFRDDVDLFLNVLERYVNFPADVRLIVLAVNTAQGNNASFIRTLGEKIDAQLSMLNLRDMILLDISHVFVDDDYYVLDDHLQSSGHEKIARAILQVLNVSK